MEDQRLQGVIFKVHVGLIMYGKHVFRFRIQTWLILRFTTLWSYLSLKDYRTLPFPELRQKSDPAHSKQLVSDYCRSPPFFSTVLL